MSNHNGGITRDDYFSRLDNGIPYEGPVEGLGYALKEVVVTPYHSSDSYYSPIFYDVSFMNVGVGYNVSPRNNHPTGGSVPSSTKGGWVQRGKEIFYDREVTCQEDVNKKYGKKVKYLKAGDVENAKYRLSRENNGTVYDRDGNRMDNTQTIYEGGFVIYATCEHCLNPATTGKNLFWLSYPGGDNPEDYKGEYTYEYVPKCPTEYPAIGHDRRYDNLNINGITGLLTNTDAIGADYQFVFEELVISQIHWNPWVRFKAGAMGLGLGILALPKTMKFIYYDNFRTPIVQIPGKIKENYDKSNQGVDNTPRKNEPYGE